MELIRVKTGCNCSVDWADSSDVDVALGDSVVIDTKQGPKLAVVKSQPFDREKTKKMVVHKVLRLATDEDLEKFEELKGRRKEALILCLERIKDHKLVMKLVDVEFLIDESKAIFYFTADGRIDFRELVKDLAHHFHTRIEMRQIGVRDEAKMVGGLGNCGNSFCCSSFLKNFEPVSVKMAKEQNLALSPMKISGACGRLMCCLAYEHKTYVMLKKKLPSCGKKISTDHGDGKVVRLDVLGEKVLVRLDTGDEVTCDLEEIDRNKEGR